MQGIEELSSYTLKKPFGCGTLYITVNHDQTKLKRIFIAVGKTGVCQRALQEALGRLISIMLEESDGSPETLERLYHTLTGIRCDKGMAGVGRLSCIDAVAQEIKKFM